MKLVVAKGNAILASRNRTLTEGLVMTDEKLEKEYGISKSRIQSFLRKGKLIELTEAAAAAALGGVVKNPPKGGGGSYGPWNMDPASLKGKAVEDLNALILGKDKSVEPFETVKEAVAFLSQSFEKR